MLAIPSTLQNQFEAYLKSKAIPVQFHGPYKKWLRYYLDFCQKYNFSPINHESLPHFIQKLQEKGQTKAQQNQASEAITLYYLIVKPGKFKQESEIYQPENSKENILYNVRDIGLHQSKQEKGASWVDEYTKLENEILVRHYSPKTLKTYKGWMQKFQAFTKSKPPESLSSDDVKEYLTFLAVKRKVSSTTQNQAFNSLLFFYRHVLNKVFGKIDGVVRAKRKSYIPVVLSREEIENILNNLSPPYDLVVKLLYGCGLRLFECLNIRKYRISWQKAFIFAATSIPEYQDL